MATIRKNRQGEWTVSIQSLGFNTTFSTRTDKKTGANRLQRQIDVRVDAVKIDGSHPFHEWPRSEQLQWLKTGNEPMSATDAPIQLFEAVDRYLEHTKNQGKAISTTASYELELNAAKNYFGDIALVGLTGTKLQNWIDKLARTSNRSGRNRGKKPNPKSLSKKLKALKRVVKWFHGLGEPNLRPDAFDTVTFGIKAPSILDQLERWTDFDTRVAELKRFGIDPATENAFAEVIYTKQQLAEQLRVLEQKLFVDGSIPSIRLYCAVQFCSATGARRKELVRVRKQDLILNDTEPYVTLTKLKGRGNAAWLRQKMPLPRHVVPALGRLLRLLPNTQQSVFAADDDHLTADGFDESEVRSKADYLTDQIRTVLKGTKWAHAAGWHIYRHSLASMMLAAGRSETEIEKMIGWKSPEIAKRYQHLSHQRKSDIINAIFA